MDSTLARHIRAVSRGTRPVAIPKYEDMREQARTAAFAQQLRDISGPERLDLRGR